jgi:hypothetical protein
MAIMRSHTQSGMVPTLRNVEVQTSRKSIFAMLLTNTLTPHATENGTLEQALDMISGPRLNLGRQNREIGLLRATLIDLLATFFGRLVLSNVLLLNLLQYVGPMWHVVA